jgi:small subunit ribosomal protein S1
MLDNQPGETPDSKLKEDEQEDFSTLFEASQNLDALIQRDTRIKGSVVSIGAEWIFVDIGGKTEGAISREELLDENGELHVQVGDPITAYVVNTKAGEVLLSVRMTAAASDDAIRGAHRSGVPVEGLVIEERKGGYSVTVLGKQAFCPYSQIDLQSGGNPSDYVGNRFSFRIVEYSERGRNIVISRRVILDEERRQKAEELKKILKLGDEIQGTVQKLASFGAFVDIGGVEGLIPMSELAWFRVNEASDILQPGETVTVRILGLDWAHNRISLSLKQTTEDPWQTVGQRYPEETVLEGTVTKLMNFGAFVYLEPGVEGLIHISNLGGGRRINHPKEVVSEGDRVEVKVISVDQDSRRIGLELRPSGGEDSAEAVEFREGDVVTGEVDSVKDYGIFVVLPGGKSGLLHVSEIGDGKTGDLRSRFSLGAKIQVQVLSVDAGTGKISLSTKSLKKHEEDSQFKEFVTDKGSRSFGTLGELLKDKIKH